MDLKEYYESLETSTTPPKTQFINEVVKKTGKTRATVYRWLSGDIIPDQANRLILSEITGIPVDELYKQEEINK